MRKSNTARILGLILAAAMLTTSVPFEALAEPLSAQAELSVEEYDITTEAMTGEEADHTDAIEEPDVSGEYDELSGEVEITDGEVSDDLISEDLTGKDTVSDDFISDEIVSADEVSTDEAEDEIPFDEGISLSDNEILPEGEPAEESKPKVEWLREGADAESIRLYSTSLAPKNLGNSAYGQVYAYEANGTTYYALYIYGTSNKASIDLSEYGYSKQIKSEVVYGDLAENTITDLVMDDNIERILTERIFFQMKKISHVRLSNSLKELSYTTFEECTSLKEITIPASLKEVGFGTFDMCSSLDTVNFAEGMVTIPENMMAPNGATASAVKTVNLPSTVKYIGDRAFDNQTQLTTVNFAPGTVLTKIGTYAFYNTNLSGISLPKFGGKWYEEGDAKKKYPKPPVIMQMAFANITNVEFETLVIPEGVGKVGQLVNQNNKFRKIYLPKSIVKGGVLNTTFQPIGTTMNTVTDIYYAGTKAQFFKAYYDANSEAELTRYGAPAWYEFMRFNAPAPKPVSGITLPSGKAIILKYYEDIPTGGTSEDFDVTISPTSHIKTEYEVKSTDESIVDAVKAGDETEGGKLPVRLLYSQKVGTAEVTISGGLATAKIKVVIKHKPKAKKPVFKVNGKTGITEVKKGDLVTVESDPADNRINIYVGSDPIEDYRLAYPNGLRVGEDIFIDASKDAPLTIKANAYAVDETLIPSDDSNITLKHVLNMGDVTNEDLFMRTKIPTGLWIADTSVSNVQYTGKAITCPGLRVFCYNKLLTKKDYTVKYENNVNVGTATVTVTGKGKYAGKGTDTKTFNIQQVDISGDGATVRIDGVPASYAYTGAEVTANISVIVNGRKLVKDTDYTLEYEDESDNPVSLIDSGDYGIKVTGKGNYTGIYKSSGPTIEDPDCVKMSEVIVSRIKPQQLVSAGTPVKPAYTVTYQGHVLEGGFLAVFKDNMSAGTAKLILFGDEEETSVGDTNVKFSGVKQVTFTIKPANLRNATVSVLPQTYTGNKLTPANADGVVMMNGTPLAYGKDYTVSYKNNVNAGRATMTIKGKGSYTGTKKATFIINKYALQDTDVKLAGDLSNYPYAVGGAKPAVKVTVDGITQTTKNYTVSYSGNSTPGGTATVTIQGKGSITGTVTKTFTVDKGDLSKCRTSFADKVYANKPKVYRQKFTVKDINGKKLKAGRDYDTEYTYLNDTFVKLKSGKKSYTTELRQAGEAVGSKDIIPARTSIKITLTGKGNYENKIKSVYRIGAKKVSSLKFSIPKQDFTGDRILPGKDMIKVTGKGLNATDAADAYEIISYGTNIKGKGTVTVRGLGNYIGTKTIKFKIK